MMHKEPTEKPPAELPRHIGLFGAVLLVVGNVIGSGIFLVPGPVAASAGSALMVMLIWAAGGVVALLGAMVYAELGAMHPRSGGLYVFLREAFGSDIAFLFGWACLLVVLTGQIAGIAIGFAEYLAFVWPSLSPSRTIVSFWGVDIGAGQIVAASAILALGAINVRGVASANGLAATLTLIKSVGLLLLPCLAIVSTAPMAEIDWAPPSAGIGPAAFSMAMIGVLWAYEGWHYAAFAAGEIRHPARTVPRALIGGTVVLVLIYCTVNLVYLQALGFAGVAASDRVAEAAATAMFGPIGGAAMVWIAIISTLGCAAATLFVASRVFYAMARDGLFFARVGQLHPRFGTPHLAVKLTAGWAAILALSGSYEQLYTYATFSALLFAVAGAAAVIILRHRDPDRLRPYRCWGYPLTPVLFIGALMLILINTAIEKPLESLLGLGLVLVGLPIARTLRPAPLSEAAT
jgi:basic amino acid/polyamine antiporter, APA family